jgi:hypothetical protein
MNDADPINPQRVFWELSPRLPDDCILTCDSGSAANWYARDLKIRRGMMASLSGGLATMGPGVPYAIAAKFCHPDRPVIALVGDGAMQMNGMNELITIAKYWREWSDPRLVVLVLNNRDLNQVTWEQRRWPATRSSRPRRTLPDFPTPSFADARAARHLRVDRPDQSGRRLGREALGADRPAVLEVVTDPNVPPLPPHIARPGVPDPLPSRRRRPRLLRQLHGRGHRVLGDGSPCCSEERRHDSFSDDSSGRGKTGSHAALPYNDAPAGNVSGLLADAVAGRSVSGPIAGGPAPSWNAPAAALDQSTGHDGVSVAAVPEPSLLPLLAIGLAGTAGRFRNRRAP